MIFKLDTIILVSGLIFAGFAQGVSGFAIGLLAAGVLVAFYPPTVVIPSLILVYFVNGIILLYEHRRFINRDLFKLNPIFSSVSLMIALVGLPVGTFFLRSASREDVVLSLGIVICSIALYYLIKEIRGPLAGSADNRPVSLARERIFCYACSSFAGVLEGFLGTGGPPIAVFLLSKRYNKLLFIASFQLFFFILMPFRFALYLSSGLYTAETVRLAAFWSIFIIAGLILGIGVRRKFVSDRMFRKIVIILLFGIGVNLLRKYM